MKVLIIDDDSQMRDYVSMYLETGFDYEILEASSGNKALIVLDLEDDFDLIICEVFIKGGDGQAILNYVNERALSCSFICLSKPENETVTWVKSSTALGFIPKPFKDPDFFPLIEKAEELSKNKPATTAPAPAPAPSASSSPVEKGKPPLNADGETADWSLAKEERPIGEEGETADWSLAKDKPDLNSEGETADWSLAKDKPDLKAEGETADWSLAKDKPDLNAEGETADWSLAKDKPDLNAEGETADW